MLTIKPDFYDQFTCIADQCSFTCCQQWKIAVDEKTNQNWKKMQPPAGVRTRRKNLSQFTQFKDGSRVISLGSDHLCPFLDERKLCRLVICYGPESISHTCQIFPREIQKFEDRTEYTLMPCCPEVIDLMNQAENFTLVQEDLPEEEADGSILQGKPELGPDHAAANRMDSLRRIRSLFMDYARNPENSAEEALLADFFLALGFMEEETDPDTAELPQKEELIHTIRKVQQNPADTFAECNELFLDLIDNYRKEGMYDVCLSDAASLAEAISAGETGEGDSYEDTNFQQFWSARKDMMRKWLLSELYADLLIADSDHESMTMKLEWVALEYTAIRHMAYLYLRRKGTLTWEDFRNVLVVVSRMMGYDEDDIREYLENSFEDAVFEWGYMALILGK